MTAESQIGRKLLARYRSTVLRRPASDICDHRFEGLFSFHCLAVVIDRLVSVVG